MQIEGDAPKCVLEAGENEQQQVMDRSAVENVGVIDVVDARVGKCDENELNHDDGESLNSGSLISNENESGETKLTMELNNVSIEKEEKHTTGGFPVSWNNEDSNSNNQANMGGWANFEGKSPVESYEEASPSEENESQDSKETALQLLQLFTDDLHMLDENENETLNTKDLINDKEERYGQFWYNFINLTPSQINISWDSCSTNLNLLNCIDSNDRNMFGLKKGEDVKTPGSQQFCKAEKTLLPTPMKKSATSVDSPVYNETGDSLRVEKTKTPDSSVQYASQKHSSSNNNVLSLSDEFSNTDDAISRLSMNGLSLRETLPSKSENINSEQSKEELKKKIDSLSSKIPNYSYMLERKIIAIEDKKKHRY